MVRNLSTLLHRLGEWADTSPTYVGVSTTQAFIEKVKDLLRKYALYSEFVTSQDGTFNGFGVWNCEFIGKKENVEIFRLVVEKLLYDYLKYYYGTAYVFTSAEFEKVADNHFIVKVFYSFNEKTWNNLRAYKETLSLEEKKKALSGERMQDEELEEELRKWEKLK